MRCPECGHDTIVECVEGNDVFAVLCEDEYCPYYALREDYDDMMKHIEGELQEL